MSGFIGLAARALLLPGVLDLRSSTKKKNPKLKFPEINQGEPLKRFVPKTYANDPQASRYQPPRKVNN